MSQSFSFFVPGIPKAQPRPRAFARKMGNGKYVARVYEAGTAENWKSAIPVAAVQNRPPSPIDGPIRVDMEFFFPRPLSHYVGGKASNPVKPTAPDWHTQKPDRDNLDKAVLDALTQIGGFWHDDAQVCAGRLSKLYGGNIGVLIRIAALC